MPGAGESPSRLTRAFPILSWLPSYQRAWLGRDGVAGLIVVCLLVHDLATGGLATGLPFLARGPFAVGGEAMARVGRLARRSSPICAT